ncbi:MAG: hypothetical protein DRH37_05525 [Deltaproteobacteria bacterium]|nr:MAG: hypothetical protein DRH37_05525 [Deltaproteobacteria bacterium]
MLFFENIHLQILRRSHKFIEGGLLLLFCVAASNFLRSSISPVTTAPESDYRKTCPLDGKQWSAFQRITLGMPVCINRGDTEALTAVPGIGPKTAALIVRERRKRGGFKRLEDLRSIRGISPLLYKRISRYLTL